MLKVSGHAKVKVIREHKSTDKFYRCMLITEKEMHDGTVVEFEFAAKIVGDAMSIIKDIKTGDVIDIQTGSLSNKKDDKYKSSHRKTQIVVHEAILVDNSVEAAS